MTIKKKIAIAILDSEKIYDVNKIISEYTDEVIRRSSHVYFDTQPLNYDELYRDMAFFKLEAEDDINLDKKLNDLIKNINQITTEYTLRDEKTGQMIVSYKFVGSLDIKFDKVKIIKKDTYKKIDALKTLKNEFGICKGYKPDFRPVESQPIEDMDIKPEHIYVLCNSSEDLSKLKELLTEKIMEIDPSLVIEYRQFT